VTLGSGAISISARVCPFSSDLPHAGVTPYLANHLTGVDVQYSGEMGAASVVVLAVGVGWTSSGETPRPITLREFRAIT